MPEYPSYLIHYGVKGQHWGERKYQYEDGSLTPEGRKHYGIGEKDLEEMRKLSKKKRSNDGIYKNMSRNPLVYHIQQNKNIIKRLGSNKAGKKLNRMIDDSINENDKNKIKKLNNDHWQKMAKLDLKIDDIYDNEKLSEEIKLKKIKDIDKEMYRLSVQYNKNLDKILVDSLGENYKNLDLTDSLKLDIDTRVSRYR